MNHSRAVIPVLYIALLAAWPLAGLGRENRSLPADAAAPAFAPAPASQGVRDGATIWWAPQFEYDSKNAEMFLSGKGYDRAWIEQADARIIAERIYWNRTTKIGRCYDRVEIISFTNDSIITGDEAWHYADDTHTIVRGNPKLSMRKSKIDVYGEELHRYGKDARSEAHRRVRIESEDGTAWGEKAIFYQRTKKIVLSEDPWIVQKSNTHRADEITLFQDENRVILRGRAKMMDNLDFVRADEIEIIEYEATNESPPASGGARTEERKNRVVFCRGDVRIYRFTNRGVLESITSGEYCELFEYRGYAKLIGNPRMVMISDNTVTGGSVMEQFQDDNIAVIKGNANITKGHRSVSAQLIIYNTKTKIAEITGSPVIKEYDDSYRADLVYYDTARDTISWRGSTMAVVGTANQNVKEKTWLTKMGAGAFTLSDGENGFQVIKSVGNVWLSMNGKPRTNSGVIDYGKRADGEDFIPRSTHIVIPDTWSWIDLLARDGMMVRLRGPAHLVLSAASWKADRAASSSGAARSQASRQSKGSKEEDEEEEEETGQALTEEPAPAEKAGSLRDILDVLWGHQDSQSSRGSGSQSSAPGAASQSARKNEDTQSSARSSGGARSSAPGSAGQSSQGSAGQFSQGSAGQSSQGAAIRGEDIAQTMIAPVLAILERALEDSGDEGEYGEYDDYPRDTRFGLTTWTLNYGVMLVKPGKTAAASITHKNFSCTNITVPMLIEADREKQVRIITLEPQTALSVAARLPSLGGITLRDKDEKSDFETRTDPMLRNTLSGRTPLVLRLDQITTSDEVLYRYITNALTNRMIELSNIEATNKVEVIEESPRVLTNRILMQVPHKDLIESMLTRLAAVAATNIPGQPFTLTLTSQSAASIIPLKLRPEVYWEGSLRTFVLNTIRGKSFWLREPLPRRETDYNELIQETEELNIRYGPQRRPPGRTDAASSAASSAGARTGGRAGGRGD